MGVHLGDSLPVHSIGAVLGGLEGHGGAHIGHQLHVGHGDLGVGAGTAGFDLHLNAAAGCKLLAEAAACGGRGVVHQNRTVAYHDGIVEGQRRRRGLVVGDGQRRTIVTATAAACPRRRPSLTDDLCATGAPRIVCSTRKAQTDVGITQTCHCTTGCRKCRQRNDGQQSQHHNCHQQQR